MTDDNLQKGWIKLYRSLQDHWLSPRKPYSEFEAWIWILFNANYKETSIRNGSEIIIVQRGDICRSLDTFAKEWGWHKSKARRFLSALQKDKIIDQKPTQFATHLTILKYNIYNDELTQQPTQLRHSCDTVATPSKESKKEIKEEKNTEGSRKFKFSFPDRLPENLNNPEFIENYQIWLDDRKARNKKVTDVAANQQLEMLSKQADAIACIKQSIRNGWTGIFPTDKLGGRNGNNDNKYNRENIERGAKEQLDFLKARRPDLFKTDQG
jgi:hypothetical protein